MKKFLKTFVIILVCLVSCVGFAGCGKKKFSPTTNITTAVESNGGIVLRHQNWIYFINGTRTNDEANNTQKSNIAAIYRVQTEDNGEIAYKSQPEATATDDEENEEPKEFLKIEKVVQSLTGFDDGSIFIFGDYLYYSTPCTSRNRDGKMLVGKTVFKRYDLKTKNEQTLYTTEQSDDTISFTYYKLGETLNLVVYEKTNATVKSLKIGDKVSTNFVKEDVTSCLLSENFGESVNGGETDTFIYYTLSYDTEGEILRGNRVYRIKADGKEEKELALDEDKKGNTISLVTIKEDHLIFSVNSYVYSQVITSTTEKLTYSEANVVCHSNYENIVFFEENGNIHAMVYNGPYLATYKWVDGEFATETIYEFDDGTSLSFVGVEGDYLVYSVSNTLYKIKYKNIAEGEENEPILLSKKAINSPSGLMAAEIMNGYVYGFSTNSSSNSTYLYRVSLDVEESKDAKEAEFIGVLE